MPEQRVWTQNLTILQVSDVWYSAEYSSMSWSVATIESQRRRGYIYALKSSRRASVGQLETQWL